jgi:type I restriction enzyme M protein
MNRPKRHQKDVLFIDASKLFRKGRNQNTLEPEHVQQIYSWYADFADVEGSVRVVPLQEIEDNDWNLNISRYIAPIIEEKVVTVEEAMGNLKQALGEAYAAEERLKHLLL